jgi:hypothetical protein
MPSRCQTRTTIAIYKPATYVVEDTIIGVSASVEVPAPISDESMSLPFDSMSVSTVSIVDPSLARMCHYTVIAFEN